MNRTRLATAALALAATLAHAAEVPIVPAGAGNRYELQIDPKTRINGLTAPQAAQFRKDVDGLVQYLRSLDAVTQPPAPVCMRLSSFLVQDAARDAPAQATVDAHIPIEFKNGSCHRMTISGVSFYLNYAGGLFRADNKLPTADGDYYLIDIAAQEGRVTRLGDGTLILSRAGALPWRPVDRQRYVQEQVALKTKQLEEIEQGERALNELIAKQGGKPPKKNPAAQRADRERVQQLERLRQEAQAGANRGAPVCVNEMGEVTAERSCPANRVVVEPNPAYWNQQLRHRIQLMTVATPAHQNMQESNDKFGARMAVWQALDIQRLLGMLAE